MESERKRDLLGGREGTKWLLKVLPKPVNTGSKCRVKLVLEADLVNDKDDGEEITSQNCMSDGEEGAEEEVGDNFVSENSEEDEDGEYQPDFEDEEEDESDDDEEAGGGQESEDQGAGVKGAGDSAKELVEQPEVGQEGDEEPRSLSPEPIRSVTDVTRTERHWLRPIIKEINYAETTEPEKSKVAKVAPRKEDVFVEPTMEVRITSSTREPDTLPVMKRRGFRRKFSPQYAYMQRNKKGKPCVRMYAIAGVCGVSRFCIREPAELPKFVNIAWLRIFDDVEKGLGEVDAKVSEILARAKVMKDGKSYTEEVSVQELNSEEEDDSWGAPLCQVKVGKEAYSEDGKLREGALMTCSYAPVPVNFDSINYDGMRLVNKFVEEKGVTLLEDEFSAALQKPGIYTIRSPIRDIAAHCLNFYSVKKLFGLKCNDINLTGEESAMLMATRLYLDKRMEDKKIGLLDIDFRPGGAFKIPYEFRYRPENGFVLEGDQLVFKEDEAMLDVLPNETVCNLTCRMLFHREVLAAHKSNVLPKLNLAERMDQNDGGTVKVRKDIYEAVIQVPDETEADEMEGVDLVETVPVVFGAARQDETLDGSLCQVPGHGEERYVELADLGSGNRVCYVDKRRKTTYLVTTEDDPGEITAFVEDQKRLKCPHPKCTIVSFTRPGLNQHMYREHRNMKIACSLCPTLKEFHYGNSIENHQKMHYPAEGRTKYCEVCWKFFKSLPGHKCIGG